MDNLILRSLPFSNIDDLNEVLGRTQARIDFETLDTLIYNSIDVNNVQNDDDDHDNDANLLINNHLSDLKTKNSLKF